MKTVLSILCIAFMATSTFGQEIAKPIKDTYQETIEPDVSTFDLATVVTPNPTKYKVAIMWYGQQVIDKILVIKSDSTKLRSCIVYKFLIHFSFLLISVLDTAGQEVRTNRLFSFIPSIIFKFGAVCKIPIE